MAPDGLKKVGLNKNAIVMSAYIRAIYSPPYDRQCLPVAMVGVSSPESVVDTASVVSDMWVVAGMWWVVFIWTVVAIWSAVIVKGPAIDFPS